MTTTCLTSTTGTQVAIKTPSLKDIATAIADRIKADHGATVEITFTGDTKDGRMAITMSGKPADVEAAKPFLSKYDLLETIHDDELGETFAYYAA